jgi:LmbE family N-acetylglucosaminyl deacetylase
MARRLLCPALNAREAGTKEQPGHAVTGCGRAGASGGDDGDREVRVAQYEQPTWGTVGAEELERVVVVSPHFDDAAMGAAYLLCAYEGSTVVTVFGGFPPMYPEVVTEWDADGGFKAGDDIVAVRREEDRAAMDVLGADPVWLEFSDHQYLAPEERPRPEDVSPSLARAITDARATAVFFPMGLANPDHVVCHDAGLIVQSELPELAWFCYEDAGYKHLPGLLSWRVAKLLRSGLWATPAVVPHDPDMERKRRAIFCYVSQIAPLEREHALTARLEGKAPEQYWRLAEPPHGWEGLSELV